MIVARWQIDARFGHKDEVIESVKRWGNEVGAKIGWDPKKMRLLTGSVGAPESTVITEVELEDMAQLNEAWDKLPTIEAHKRWSKELEPLTVSGSNRWEILRTV